MKKSRSVRRKAPGKAPKAPVPGAKKGSRGSAPTAAAGAGKAGMPGKAAKARGKGAPAGSARKAAGPVVPASVEAYLAGFPLAVRARLRALRKAVRAAAPGAEERISYGIPSYFLGKSRVHIAGYPGHLGFYPAPVDHADFRKDLAPYASGRATARFPHDRPLPLSLVARMVRFQLGGAPGRGKPK